MKLAAMQRQLWRLITAPEGVSTALAEGGGREAFALEALVRGSEALAAAERLEVYANAYFQRIHAVLAQDHPALAAAIGADAFHDLTTSYLLVCPPERPSLRHAGERLASFVAEHEATRGVRERAPWAADLAHLEWAMVDAFDARDCPALTRASLSALAPEAFGMLPLALRPGAQLLQLEFPVERIRAAHGDGAALPLPLPAAHSRVLVWRHAERVRFRSLGADEAAALALVAGSTRFDQLCERAASDTSEAAAPAIVAGWLAQWVADGLLADL